jgi:methyl-accepting chemotaxis protein
MTVSQIFRFHKDVKIKNKLIGGFLAVILLLGIVLGIYQYAIMTIIKGYDKAIDLPIKAAFHMDNAGMFILQNRLNNEKFMTNYQSEFLIAADKNISQVLSIMENVKDDAKKSGRKDLEPVFASIEAQYLDYKNNYDELITTLKNKKQPEKIKAMVESVNGGVEKLKTTIDTIQVEAHKDATKFVEMTRNKSKIITRTARITSVGAALFGLVWGIFISINISNPIRRAVDFAGEISKGDFSVSLEMERKDEVGVLASAMNRMKNNLSNMIKELKDTSQMLSSSASELSAISSQMASGSETTSQRANNVSASSEEMSANIAAVAAAMEESSTNTGMVATAAEQMTATIDEIAQNTEKAQTISNDAVQRSKNASTKMNELGKAALAIGKVTETIAEISEQTNLLALNATIEAARAGDAGKGFAVVANEIKELANQTAAATLDIKNRIEGVQQTTNSTVSEIDQISQVINDIDEIVVTISAAIEEQSSATRDIANNISQASQGIREVNENINKSAQMASSITEDIAMVGMQTQEVSNGSSQVNLSAEELSRFSEQLNHMVERFKV